MSEILRFVLNADDVTAAAHPGTTVLDYVRGVRRLCGTKIGCREGDCGACTVLVGELRPGGVAYRSMTSCLLPLANVHGKHVVTIEGLNPASGLTPVQRAMADAGATQCGFCTVGFVVSLTGYCLDGREPSLERALAAIDGNICRCTGYKSIERATAPISALLATCNHASDRVGWLVEHDVLPAYFRGIEARLRGIAAAAAADVQPVRAGGDAAATGSDGQGVATSDSACNMGGGTDLYVQRPETLTRVPLRRLFDDTTLRGVRVDGDHCTIGASTTFEELRDDPVLQSAFPRLRQYLELVASTPIRNMATLGGNLVNASPIGDLTIFFLAQDAEAELRGPRASRWLPLARFYKGYKTLDRAPGEILSAVRFALPSSATRVNFEKVSKRRHLDIASVNSAARFEVQGQRIEAATMSAGGVAPVPLVPTRASAFLRGRTIDARTAAEAAEIAVGEIRPIDDARGSAEYKSLLLRQLVWAHFLTLFPQHVGVAELVG